MVRVGTLFGSSHVPLFKWFQAVYLLASSKKGISAYQSHRTLEVRYKTAWFMFRRLRGAMRSGRLDVMGSDGGIVEFVITGKARGMVVDDLKAEMLVPILKENIDREVRTITGEAG